MLTEFHLYDGFFSEEKARVRREASNANVLEMERSNGKFSIMYLFLISQ
jgi:hypothetical protein